jgi:hypothetical protein
MDNPYLWIKKKDELGWYIARPHYLHPDGVWRSSMVGPDGVQLSGYFTTKAEAEQALQHWLRTKPAARTIQKLLENLAWYQEQLKLALQQHLALEHQGRSHQFEDREDGLWNCLVCGGAEGSLPRECPGICVDGDQLDLVYAGKMDFKNGQWEVGGGRW